MSRLEVHQVADGLHLVETDVVNWVVAVEGERVALVDAGYPGQLEAVEESLRRIGVRLEQVTDVLVTHAHVDHVGTLPTLVDRYGVTVRAGVEELPNLRGERVESATPVQVAARSWRPRVLTWSLRITALGGTQHPTVSDPVAVTPGEALDLPGAPVPVAVPGHTSGSTAYLFPAAGAIALGDALITGHRITRRRGPQMIEDFFHHDAARAVASLETLRAVEADVLMPGHGPLVRMPLTDAVAAVAVA